MMRVFMVVGRAGSRTIVRVSTPRAWNASNSCCARESSPTRPTRTGSAPSAARVAATLPAPPSELVSFCTSTTGTGASGEMRSQRPHK